MIDVPVIDYQRLRRIYPHPEQVGSSEMTISTKICIGVIILGLLGLLKRFMDTQRKKRLGLL